MKRKGKNLLRACIRPIAAQLGIPGRPVTFQVMRRTIGTGMQHHDTLKDTHGVLGHASLTTTGDVYVQMIDESVFRAVNSRANAVLDGWVPELDRMERTGRQPRMIEEKIKGKEVHAEIFPTGLSGHEHADREQHSERKHLAGSVGRARLQGTMTGHGFKELAGTFLHENDFDEAHVELQLRHARKNRMAASFDYAKYIPKRAGLMQWCELKMNSLRSDLTAVLDDQMFQPSGL